MNSRNDTEVVAGPEAGQISHTHRLRGLAVTGVFATLVAMMATTLAATLARAVGVDFEVPEGGEAIPLSGIAVVTGFFSVVASSLPSLFFVGALAPPSDSCGRQCL